MVLTKTKMVRLYAVSECLDKNGLYKLKPFEADKANQVYPENCSIVMLPRLRKYLCDDGEIYQLGNENYKKDGTVRIPIGQGEIVIENIIDKIDSDPDKSTYYIVFDKKHSQYWWVVAKVQGIAFWDRLLLLLQPNKMLLDWMKSMGFRFPAKSDDSARRSITHSG